MHIAELIVPTAFGDKKRFLDGRNLVDKRFTRHRALRSRVSAKSPQTFLFI